MPKDYSGQNLRGRSFKGQNLTAANFSRADIRGANFTNATLRGANFRHAKAGLQRRWVIGLVIVLLLLSALSGFTAAFAGFIAGRFLSPEAIHRYTIFPGVTVLIMFAVFFIVTIRQGFGAALGVVAVVIAVAVVVGAMKVTVAVVVVGAMKVTVAVVVAGAMAFAEAVAFAVAGAMLVAATGAFAGVFAVAGVVAGAVAFALSIAAAGYFAVTGSLAMAVAVALLGAYTARRPFSGEQKFTLIRSIAIAFAAIGGTSFYGADLTEADFTQATLKSTDFRNAILARTRWFHARNLDQSRVGNTLLANTCIRDLLVSGIGRNKSYVGLDLKGANLIEADLSHANLTEADISEATLEGACLEWANLTKTQALAANFRDARLTGACLEAWNINSTTQLDGAICDYFYLLNNQRERRPSSGEFAPRDFAKLFQVFLSTVDLIFHDGIDEKAFTYSFNKLILENEGTELSIQSIERKGDGVVVRVSIPAEANRKKIHSDFTQNYQLALKAIETKYQAEFKSKDELLSIYRQRNTDLQEVIKLLASRPVNIDAKAIAESKAMAQSIIPQPVTVEAKVMTESERFLKQAGATIHLESNCRLQVVTVQGRLEHFAPLPILLVDNPSDQDVDELVQHSELLVRDRPKRAGVLIYREPPNTLVRMQIAKVRLEKSCVVIPIPLAAVQQVLPDDDECFGLLNQYAERYLPGANLFDDRNAIGDTLSFFGRTELLNSLEEDLLNYQGVGLFGLRKSGKTSVLLQLRFALRRHPVVYIDLQNYGGKPRYGAELFNEILQRLFVLARDRSPDLAPLSEPFADNLPGAELATKFAKQVGELGKMLQEADYELPILCFLDEVERLLPTQADSREKVEEFNACFGALRALSQEQRKLTLLVADVHPDCNRINHWLQEGVPTNPVFNFFKEVFPSQFSEEETARMLTDIGRLMALDFDGETLAAIHRESGGHPFVARQLASSVYKKLFLKGDTSSVYKKLSLGEDGRIELPAAQRYLKKPFTYSDVLRDYFGQSIWGDLKKRNFEATMAILRVLACNNEESSQGVTEEVLLARLSGDFTESQCLNALLWLEAVGLVARKETVDNDYYGIQVPLLSRWLRMQMREEEIRQWQIQ